MGDKYEKAMIEEGWEKVAGWECSFLHRKLQLFFSVYVDHIEMEERERVDLNDPVSFPVQVYLGCTQRAAQVNSRIVMGKAKLFSKLISTNTNVKTEKKKPQTNHSLELRLVRSRSKVCWKC